jgi:uncharacterized membrane protein YbhN (UPF0104 family)
MTEIGLTNRHIRRPPGDAAMATIETKMRTRPQRRRLVLDRRLTTLGLLGLLALSLLLSLPGMPAALHSIEGANLLWIAAAVALELASDTSFVVVYRLFFDRLARRDARALAWTSQAAGALLPGGGVGGYAVSGWLTRLTGQPTTWIVRRSSALFFLTSGVNAAAVIVPGALLLAGVAGPHDFLLGGLPAMLASAATLIVLALPAVLRRRGGGPEWIANVVTGVPEARHAAAGANWRLLGALGYLGFDIAVLCVTLLAAGQPLSVPAVMLAYSIGYLANSLPIPGGIGVLDAGLTGALILYGASPVHAASAVLLYHAIALWVPGLGGFYAYLRLRPRLVQTRSVSRRAAREALSAPAAEAVGSPA